MSVATRWAGTSADPAADLPAVREVLRGAGGVVVDVGPVGFAWTTPAGDLVTVKVGRMLAVSVDSRCFRREDVAAARRARLRRPLTGQEQAADGPALHLPCVPSE